MDTNSTLLTNNSIKFIIRNWKIKYPHNNLYYLGSESNWKLTKLMKYLTSKVHGDVINK